MKGLRDDSDQGFITYGCECPRGSKLGSRGSVTLALFADFEHEDIIFWGKGPYFFVRLSKKFTLFLKNV